MSPLVGLLVILLSAVAAVGLFFWLERRLRLPGLAFLAAALSCIIGGVLGLMNGQRLLPILFLLQVPGFLYSAHARRTAARATQAGTQAA